ncbi:MAG: hypothetical protein HY336_02840 [Candidatus Doudnabacteria bacterium]|nr:hypothetical protein [Candidatus Doudnabacteria bacterium]
MTKISQRIVSDEDYKNYLNELWSSFTLVESKEQLRDFCKDLFTRTEYKMFAKRLQIARLLLEGNTYEEIGNRLKVTEKTILNVNNVLAERGKGYRNVHAKLFKIEKEILVRKSKRIDQMTGAVRRKLPAETVLPNLLKSGFILANRTVRKKIKQSSARRDLEV